MGGVNFDSALFWLDIPKRGAKYAFYKRVQISTVTLVIFLSTFRHRWREPASARKQHLWDRKRR